MVFSLLSSPKQPDIDEIIKGEGVNYDDGPTKLYSLIESREWKSVVIRSTKTPFESATWVYRTEKGSDKLRWKQLPLHAAIVFGANEVVIHALLRSFPRAAEISDDQGMLPIHLAFRHNANEEVIDMLLKAFPDGAEKRDRKGRIPITLVRVSENGESNTLRAYMANFIFERSNVVVAEQKEQKMKEMTDTFTEDIRLLQSELEQEKQQNLTQLRELEEKLVTANDAFHQWSKDTKPDKLEFHNRDQVSLNELHDSIIYSIERFAEKADRMEQDKSKGVEEGIQDIKDKMRQMEVKHQSELDALVELVETDKLEGLEMKVAEKSKQQKDKLAQIKTQLVGRLSEFEQQEEKLKEVKQEGESYAEKVLELSTKVLQIEKVAQEERSKIEEEHSQIKKKTIELEAELSDKERELEQMNNVEAENKSLQKKVDELLTTMNDVRRESKNEIEIMKNEYDKNTEELNMAKETLCQASETVQTLEDQMAKLYVEKEGLRSRYYSLQQTTSATERNNEETIFKLEKEVENGKKVMEMQSEKITELTSKFEGLAALREKEIEISNGKETLLSAKVEHLTTKYESFQLEIDEYNERSESYNTELQNYKYTVSKLEETLAAERKNFEEMEEKYLEKKESEILHASRVQELAGSLAKVSMERKQLMDNFEEEKSCIKGKYEQESAESLQRVNELQRIMDDTQDSIDRLNKRCLELENENESLRNSLEEMAKKFVRSAVEQRNVDRNVDMPAVAQASSIDSENETLQDSLTVMKSEIDHITSSFSTLIN